MTEVFGTAGRLLTFHRYVYLHWRTDHLHSGHLNILPQFTSITATGTGWLALPNQLTESKNEICPRPRTRDEKHKTVIVESLRKDWL